MTEPVRGQCGNTRTGRSISVRQSPPVYPDAHRALLYKRHLDRSLVTLARTAEQLPDAIRPSDTSAFLLGYHRALAKEVDQSLLPSVALELSSRRDHLTGEMPADRYHDAFVSAVEGSRLHDHVADTYARVIGVIPIMINNSMRSVERMINRLCQDWQDLPGSLALTTAGRLLTLETGLGDRHNGGQQVCILTFENGRKIVYKPRSAATDGVLDDFQRSVAFPEGLCSTQVDYLDRGSHAWCEYIASSEIEPDSGSDYWRRAGAMLAAADVLNFTDGHFENIVATKGGPVLVDHETLMQNARQDYEDYEDEEHSVLFTGLIQSKSGEDEGRGITAAYQVAGDKQGHYLYPHPINERTDNLEVRFIGAKHAPLHNYPKQDGEYVSGTAHVGDLVEGMEEAYLHVRRHRRLLQDSGFLERVRGLRVRQLVRATMYYAFLIRRLEQPSLAADVDKAKAFLRSKLFVNFSVDPDRALIDPNVVVDYEIRCLLNQDIPIFYSETDSRDLISGEGQRFPNFFPDTAMEQVQYRLMHLSDPYIARQSEIVRQHIDLGYGV